MKKLLSIALLTIVLMGGTSVTAMAQSDSATNDNTEKVAPKASAATDAIDALTNDEFSENEIEEGGIHQELKSKFIEGDAAYMSLVALAFVIGLALCIERIIYLSLAEVDTKKLMGEIENKLKEGDTEGAKEVCRNTRGPVASICYQGLLRVDKGLENVERSIVSYAGVQSTFLEQHCSWITLFIAMAPSLGFLGTVIGMVKAFEAIEMAGDLNPTIVAGGMKVALITTIFGIIVALVLQIFYNYILSKIESLTTDMEDSSITLLDMLVKYDIKK